MGLLDAWREVRQNIIDSKPIYEPFITPQKYESPFVSTLGVDDAAPINVASAAPFIRKRLPVVDGGPEHFPEYKRPPPPLSEQIEQGFSFGLGPVSEEDRLKARAAYGLLDEPLIDQLEREVAETKDPLRYSPYRINSDAIASMMRLTGKSFDETINELSKTGGSQEAKNLQLDEPLIDQLEREVAETKDPPPTAQFIRDQGEVLDVPNYLAYLNSVHAKHGNIVLNPEFLITGEADGTLTELRNAYIDVYMDDLRELNLKINPRGQQTKRWVDPLPQLARDLGFGIDEDRNINYDVDRVKPVSQAPEALLPPLEQWNPLPRPSSDWEWGPTGGYDYAADPKAAPSRAVATGYEVDTDIPQEDLTGGQKWLMATKGLLDPAQQSYISEGEPYVSEYTLWQDQIRGTPIGTADARQALVDEFSPPPETPLPPLSSGEEVARQDAINRPTLSAAPSSTRQLAVQKPLSPSTQGSQAARKARELQAEIIYPDIITTPEHIASADRRKVPSLIDAAADQIAADEAEEGGLGGLLSGPFNVLKQRGQDIQNMSDMSPIAGFAHKLGVPLASLAMPTPLTIPFALLSMLGGDNPTPYDFYGQPVTDIKHGRGGMNWYGADIPGAGVYSRTQGRLGPAGAPITIHSPSGLLESTITDDGRGYNITEKMSDIAQAGFEGAYGTGDDYGMGTTVTGETFDWADFY